MDNQPLMVQALADRIDATKRQVQIWTDAGAIVCRPETDRRGRGSQRLYDQSEVPIAALVAMMARFMLPIGMLVAWSRSIRDFLAGKPGEHFGRSRDWFQAALAGEFDSFLVLTPEPRDLGGSFVWVDHDKMATFVNSRAGVAVINVRTVVSNL